VPHTHTQPIELGRELGASLTVGLRAGDLTWSPRDDRVLRLVAPLLGQTLRARALAADLQSSRQDTITAREEERRRVRNDLHDELGPRLSGIAFTTDAARNSLRSDPEGADELLRSLRAETGTAIEEIRRIAYGMRPPALDELGLVTALRQQASVLRTPLGAPLLTTITDTDLPASLPAAVEVAAYRIVVEALTNAARHSGGSVATVDLRLRDGVLLIDVADDGSFADRWPAGVGLASMRERAAELGGRLSAHGNGPGGRVSAELPLPRGCG